MQCEFCENEAEWKVFLAVKREMSKSRHSYIVTRPNGLVEHLSRQLTTFRKLEGSFVVRIPIYFREEGTPVCERCSLDDDVLGFADLS
ncbi:MAG: hypothetical protein V3U52_08995 [Thermoplasmata archaeon]